MSNHLAREKNIDAPTWGKQNGHPVKINLIYIHEQQKSTIKYYCTCIRHFFTTYIENLLCIGRMLQCIHVVKQLMRIVKISNTQGNLKIAGSNILLRFSEQFDGDILLKLTDNTIFLAFIHQNSYFFLGSKFAQF